MPAVMAATTPKGGCCCSARPAGGACQPGAVQTANVMTRHRNACARQACVTDTTRGNRNKTVMPPRVPWSNTASTAPRASQRTQRRDSHWVSSTISTTVSKPTNAATRRCPCSNSTPPTIGGNTCPKDNGQSGTAKPEPVLVTNAPTKIKTSVAPAVSTAKRCTHTGHIESLHALCGLRFPLLATASAEGGLIKGGPFPASVTAEGVQLNVPPSLWERVRVLQRR